MARLLFLLLAWQSTTVPQSPGQLVDIGGRKIHVHCKGAAGATVIVLTGGGSFSIEWAAVQDSVARFARICVYDRAGYAWSERGAIDDGIAETVDDFTRLERAADLKPPYVLVGHSMGALFARAYQRRFPDRVAGMVFVDGTHDENIGFPVDGKRVPLAILPREQLSAAFADYRKQLPPLHAEPRDAPPLNQLSEPQRVMRGWAFEKLVEEIGWLPNSIAAAESWREEFHALREQRLSGPHPLGSLPLRVLERAKDTNDDWHRQQEELSRLSANSRLQKAEGSGHSIHIERPDLVTEAIREIAPDTLSQTVSFRTEDGGLIYGDLYGSGERGVVLAHGVSTGKVGGRKPLPWSLPGTAYWPSTSVAKVNRKREPRGARSRKVASSTF